MLGGWEVEGVLGREQLGVANLPEGYYLCDVIELCPPKTILSFGGMYKELESRDRAINNYQNCHQKKATTKF